MGKTVSFKRAAIINAFSQYSNIILGIGFNAVLARILTPDEFGVFAVVSIFTTFFSKIYDSGFGAAVIQRKDLQKSDIDSIYAFMRFVALGLAVLFLLLGLPVSKIYDNSEYVIIFAALAVAVLFNTFNVVPYSTLLREKQFYKVAFLNITGHVLSYAAAIALALLGFKYYALAFQVVILAVFKFCMSKKLSGVSAAKKIDKAPIKSVMSFTLYELSSSMINYLEQNLDNILVSLTMGSTMLGFYSKSYTLTKYPVTAVSGAVTPVLHPILSDYQDDKKKMHDKYMQFLTLVSTIAVFVSAACFFCAREIVLFLYGGQWESCVPSFTYLSLCIFPLFLMSGNIAIYKSLGRTNLLFRVVLVNTGITCAAIVSGILLGSIETVAMCVCVANWSNMIVTLCVLNRVGFGVRLMPFWKRFIPDIAVLFATQFLLTKAVQPHLPQLDVFVLLIIKAAIVGVIYLLYLLISRRYRLVLQLLFNKKQSKEKST